MRRSSAHNGKGLPRKKPPAQSPKPKVMVLVLTPLLIALGVWFWPWPLSPFPGLMIRLFTLWPSFFSTGPPLGHDSPGAV